MGRRAPILWATRENPLKSVGTHGRASRASMEHAGIYVRDYEGMDMHFLRKHAPAAEPPLLSLHGRIDHQVLEDAVAAVERGDYPEWCIMRDTHSTGVTSWRHTLAALASTVIGMFNQPSSGPQRIVVVEHTPTQRQASLRFDYLGEANGLPLWGRA